MSNTSILLYYAYDKNNLSDIINFEQCYKNEETVTCPVVLPKAGETDEFVEMPEPDNISLRMPLIPRRSKVLAHNGDPLAQVETSRIKPCKP